MKTNLKGVNLRVDLNNDKDEDIGQDKNLSDENKEINLETGEVIESDKIVKIFS